MFNKMKKTNGFIIFLIGMLILTFASKTFSQDWPQFRGIARDSKVTDFKVPQVWPHVLTQVWKLNVGFGDATPVLSGNRIYLATRQENNEVILCLDATSGKELWKSSYPAVAVTGPSSSHPGPRSTPALANGKIVAYGVTGILSCLDMTTGKVLWRKENPTNDLPQFFTAMSPLLVDGLCIAHLGGQNKGEVVALDLTSGAERWKWTGDGPSYASPSIMILDGKKHVIVQTEKNLISLNLTDGKLLWQVPTPAQQRFYNCPSPYVNGQIIYYTGQGAGTKAIKVKKDGDRYVPEELWSNPEIGAKWNTPILKEGFLYGFTDQKRIYCLDASTGKVAWMDNAVNNDFATIVDCGSVIVGLPGTGNLLVFKPDEKQYTEIIRYKVSDTPIYAFPVLAGNLIYIKDAESLILYRIN
jgi:outer membrane protein assembly factor BamB